MEGEIDRRVVRTRRALHEALIRLIKRKGYDALTVQEITICYAAVSSGFAAS
jgi:AcrR family transcriptional regulator